MGESVNDSNISVTIVVGCKQLGGTSSQKQDISKMQPVTRPEYNVFMDVQQLHALNAISKGNAPGDYIIGLGN